MHLTSEDQPEEWKKWSRGGCNTIIISSVGFTKVSYSLLPFFVTQVSLCSSSSSPLLAVTNKASNHVPHECHSITNQRTDGKQGKVIVQHNPVSTCTLTWCNLGSFVRRPRIIRIGFGRSVRMGPLPEHELLVLLVLLLGFHLLISLWLQFIYFACWFLSCLLAAFLSAPHTQSTRNQISNPHSHKFLRVIVSYKAWVKFEKGDSKGMASLQVLFARFKVHWFLPFHWRMEPGWNTFIYPILDVSPRIGQNWQPLNRLKKYWLLNPKEREGGKPIFVLPSCVPFQITHWLLTWLQH